MDLLQPVYEEIAKEEPPPSLVKVIAPGKLKERGNVQVKKTVNRKVKKRRYAEYAEEREEVSILDNETNNLKYNNNNIFFSPLRLCFTLEKALDHALT